MTDSHMSEADLQTHNQRQRTYFEQTCKPTMTWQGDGGVVRMRKGLLFKAMQDAGLQNLRCSRFGFFPPALANRPWGARVESVLENLPPLKPFLPFQMVVGNASPA